MRIHDLKEHKRPRERLHAAGPTSLTEAELIAIIIGNGWQSKNAIQLAQHLLKKFTFPGLLHSSPRQLMTITGIGEAKSAQLCVAFELRRRKP